MTGPQPTKDRLILDMVETNRETEGKTITQNQYEKHGKYNPWQARNRFGSWSEAKASAGVYSNQRRRNKVTGKKILEDLKEVNGLTENKLTVQDYKDKGSYSLSSLYNHFDSFDTAVRKAYNI
jgi:hypothetical protein